jgi:hypothetical protein
MKGNANTRNPNKFCRFYHDNKYDTKECRVVKKEIKWLIGKGYLN